MSKVKTFGMIGFINLDELSNIMFNEQEPSQEEFDEFNISLRDIIEAVLDVASGLDIDEDEVSYRLRAVLERAENEAWGSVEEFYAFVDGVFSC